jgi:hypothetical protein
VDDNEVSHVDPAVVTDILEKIKGNFGDIVISRGKEHEFLGMNIKLRDDGLIEIKMKNKSKKQQRCLATYVPTKLHHHALYIYGM